jgi:putative sporulation protein YtxC
VGSLKRILVGSCQSLQGLDNYLERAVAPYASSPVTVRKIQRGHLRFTEYAVDGAQEYNDQAAGVVAEALTAFIVEVWEPGVIGEMIRKEFCYFDEEEHDVVTRMAVRLLEENAGPVSGGRKAAIREWVAECLARRGEVVVEGLLRFRFKGYIPAVEDAMELAVDEYLTDREYQEFIKLLRYFLDLQKPRPGQVHLLCGTLHRLLDEDGVDLEAVDVVPPAVERKRGQEVSPDDLVVSRLIVLAPACVKIHLGGEGVDFPMVADTLLNVFQERASICHGCAVCR